jgi:hypothetical protein
MRTNILPLPMVVGLLVGLVLIVGWLQGEQAVSAVANWPAAHAAGTDKTVQPAGADKMHAGRVRSGTAADYYREIYRMETLGEKKRAMAALSDAERREVWRLHFNDVRQHFDVTPVQSAILDQTAEAIGRHDLDALLELEREADAAFPPPAHAGGTDKGLRFAAFATIGAYKSVGQFCPPPNGKWLTVSGEFAVLAAAFYSPLTTHRSPLFADCPCNLGSGFNMSCYDPCSGGSSCSQQPDGCGFGWLFPCNGSCRTERAPLEEPPGETE